MRAKQCLCITNNEIKSEDLAPVSQPAAVRSKMVALLLWIHCWIKFKLRLK